jgi:hypothetical protein
LSGVFFTKITKNVTEKHFVTIAIVSAICYTGIDHTPGGVYDEKYGISSENCNITSWFSVIKQ